MARHPHQPSRDRLDERGEERPDERPSEPPVESTPPTPPAREAHGVISTRNGVPPKPRE